MVPANPPLPTPRNRPFHAFNGIHTSILISESLVGVSVAATRQNGGRFINGWEAPGGTSDPAVTGVAMVIRVCGTFSSVSDSQRTVAAARDENAPKMMIAIAMADDFRII